MYSRTHHNGSGGSVWRSSSQSRWRKARPNLEVDEWVEEISFGETKKYVKKVFGNWAVYQMLYGKASPEGLPIPIGVPMVPK